MTLKVLLVDDNPDIRDLVAMTVGLAGHDVEILEAVNGLDALSVARDFNPDVVVLDLDMPVMDGRIAGHALRGFSPAPTVLAYSAMLDSDDRPCDWADEYFDKGELQRLVAKLVTIPAA